MAAFHARVARDLRRPASVHYRTLLKYLTGEAGWDAWRGLGLQGLAANRSGQPFFNECLADLLFVPGVRDLLRASLRD